MACLEERKVDPDGTKLMRADTTGEERNLSKTAVNVDKVESSTKVKTDKTQRTLLDQAGEVRNCSNASDKGEQVETRDYFNCGKLDRPQRRNTLVDRNETGPIRATRKRTETWRTRRKITHWWSTLLVTLTKSTTDIVQASVDRHQNFSSRHCPNKLSVLTVRNGCNGAHSRTWGKIGNFLVWSSGGDDLFRRSAIWARGERQLRHRRTGKKHEAQAREKEPRGLDPWRKTGYGSGGT